MMSDEFGNLSRDAANSLVSAMATDAWEAVKQRFVAAFGREHQVDATHAELARSRGADLAAAKSAQAAAWATRLWVLLDDDPRAAQAIQEFLNYLHATLEPAPTAQPQYVQGGPAVGGNFTGLAGIFNNSGTGDVNIGSGKIDKRRYKFFAPPLLFTHAANAVTQHLAVTITTVVVVAVGGVTGGYALTHRGTNTPAASAPQTVAPPAPSSATWGALQGGPARTGNQPAETRIGTVNVSKLTQVRTYKSNSEVGESTAPLVANGVLYVATNELYAFDATGSTNCSAAPTTCTPLWTAPAANIHSLAIANGRVFVSDGEGIQAYDAAGSENCSGTPKVCAPLWATSTNIATGPGFSPGPGSPVVANGVLYVPGYGDGMAPSVGGSSVAAFDVAGTTDCKGTPTICVPMWTTTGLPVSSGNGGSPSIANGVLYIANGATLQAFDAAGSTGCSGTPKVCAPLWTGSMSGNEVNSAAPAVANGIVYVDNPLSGLYAFDATGTTNCSATATGKTCAPLWNAPSVKGSGGAPAVANGVVYYVGSGGLTAFDATAATNCPGTGTVKTCTRAPLWTSAPLAAGYLASSPTVANGVVYVSATGGEGGLYAYDAAGSLHCLVSNTANSGTAKECSPLWSGVGTGLTAGASPEIGGGSPAIINGVVFAGSGTIYAFSL
jgi:PQQ-like domain